MAHLLSLLLIVLSYKCNLRNWRVGQEEEKREGGGELKAKLFYLSE